MNSWSLAPAVQNVGGTLGATSSWAWAKSAQFGGTHVGVNALASAGIGDGMRMMMMSCRSGSSSDRRLQVDVRAASDATIGEANFGATKGVGVVNGNNGAGNNGGTMMTESRPFTGGAIDFRRATEPLTPRLLENAKTVVLVRHGLSSWNEEGRVQGRSDESVLSDVGKAQALRVRDSIAHMKFEKCFASPISRAKTSAELIWEGREEPLVYLDTLREANLLFLEGMLNEDAKEQYPELFRAWREDPQNFNVDGVYPVVELWAQAKKAWEEILASPGERLLVVTHKSILRAMLCTALGIGPERFRAVDVHNAGISTFTVNTRGEPMLQSLNRTAHLHIDGVHYLD